MKLVWYIRYTFTVTKNNTVPPKRGRLFTSLHGVTFHNTENLICNAMRNSILISLYIQLLCNKHKQSTDFYFYILLTAHLNDIFLPTWCTNYFYTFITVLYMFRALLCSSSGGQIVLTQHLVSSLFLGDCSVHKLREESTDSLLPDVDEIWYTRSEHLWEWPHICYDSQWNHLARATYKTYAIFSRNTNLRKATISLSCLSVRPSAVMELGSYWKFFHEISCWVFFENLSRKFKFH